MIAYTLRVASQLLVHSKFGPRALPNEAYVQRMRAWPWLCDAYRHLNNAAYLRLAEDARWAWTARTPLLKQALSQRWTFLVGGADIVYRRSIDLMSSFSIVSKLEGADERWLYFSQEFVLANGQSACRILLRAMIRGPQGLVAPEEILRIVGSELPSMSAELEQLKALGSAQLSAMQHEAG